MTSRNRKRLNDLPEEIARRIDEVILDLADGAIEGKTHPEHAGFVFENRDGDQIVYDIDATHLYVDDFVTVEEEALE